MSDIPLSESGRKMRYLHLNLSEFDPEIRAKISQRWGIGRVFRWLRGRASIIGETILLAHILRISRTFNMRYTERSIRRVINRDFEEQDLDPEAKSWLIGIVYPHKGNRFQRPKSSKKGGEGV